MSEVGKYRFYAFKLAGICILVFFIQMIFAGFTDMFLLSAESWTQIWRFVTSIFLHADGVHLLYNMFALILFGGILEKLIGSKRLLIVFFTTGILANIISINFYSSSLGASGAIFGLIGALIVVRPGLMIWAFGMPMPIIVAGILWMSGDLIGIFIPSNVANIAHLAGIGFGLMFGEFYRKLKLGKIRSSREQDRKRKVIVDEKSVRVWENYHMK